MTPINPFFPVKETIAKKDMKAAYTNFMEEMTYWIEIAEAGAFRYAKLMEIQSPDTRAYDRGVPRSNTAKHYPDRIIFESDTNADYLEFEYEGFHGDGANRHVMPVEFLWNPEPIIEEVEQAKNRIEKERQAWKDREIEIGRKADEADYERLKKKLGK